MLLWKYLFIPVTHQGHTIFFIIIIFPATKPLTAGSSPCKEGSVNIYREFIVKEDTGQTK